MAESTVAETPIGEVDSIAANQPVDRTINGGHQSQDESLVNSEHKAAGDKPAQKTLGKTKHNARPSSAELREREQKRRDKARELKRQKEEEREKLREQRGNGQEEANALRERLQEERKRKLQENRAQEEKKQQAAMERRRKMEEEKKRQKEALSERSGSASAHRQPQFGFGSTAARFSDHKRDNDAPLYDVSGGFSGGKSFGIKPHTSPRPKPPTVPEEMFKHHSHLPKHSCVHHNKDPYRGGNSVNDWAATLHPVSKGPVDHLQHGTDTRSLPHTPRSSGVHTPQELNIRIKDSVDRLSQPKKRTASQTSDTDVGSKPVSPRSVSSKPSVTSTPRTPKTPKTPSKPTTTPSIPTTTPSRSTTNKPTTATNKPTTATNKPTTAANKPTTATIKPTATPLRSVTSAKPRPASKLNKTIPSQSASSPKNVHTPATKAAPDSSKTPASSKKSDPGSKLQKKADKTPGVVRNTNVVGKTGPKEKSTDKNSTPVSDVQPRKAEADSSVGAADSSVGAADSLVGAAVRSAPLKASGSGGTHDADVTSSLDVEEGRDSSLPSNVEHVVIEGQASITVVHGSQENDVDISVVETGEVDGETMSSINVPREVDATLEQQSSEVGATLDQQSNEVDATLDQQSNEVGATLEQQSNEVDSTLEQQSNEVGSIIEQENYVTSPVAEDEAQSQPDLLASLNVEGGADSVISTTSYIAQSKDSIDASSVGDRAEVGDENKDQYAIEVNTTVVETRQDINADQTGVDQRLQSSEINTTVDENCELPVTEQGNEFIPTHVGNTSTLVEIGVAGGASAGDTSTIELVVEEKQSSGEDEDETHDIHHVLVTKKITTVQHVTTVVTDDGEVIQTEQSTGEPVITEEVTETSNDLTDVEVENMMSKDGVVVRELVVTEQLPVVQTTWNTEENTESYEVEVNGSDQVDATASSSDESDDEEEEGAGFPGLRQIVDSVIKPSPDAPATS